MPLFNIIFYLYSVYLVKTKDKLSTSFLLCTDPKIVALCWIRCEKDCGIESSALWERQSATATGTNEGNLTDPHVWSMNKFGTLRFLCSTRRHGKHHKTYYEFKLTLLWQFKVGEAANVYAYFESFENRKFPNISPIMSPLQHDVPLIHTSYGTSLGWIRDTLIINF